MGRGTKKKAPKPLRKSAKKPQDDTVYMKPEGGPDGHRRTPVNIGDPYKGKGIYIPEKVVSTMVSSRTKFYRVIWKGLPANAATWEPEAHLDRGTEGQSCIEAYLKEVEETLKKQV